MVGALSIAPLVAGFAAALLGVLGLTLPEQQLHGRTCFVLFCISSGSWAFAHFLILALSASSAPLASPYLSSVFWLGAATLLGIGGAPTYWFLFAAAMSGHGRWLDHDRAILVHIPFLYLLLVGLTNPLHGMYVAIDPVTGGARYGPLAYVHIAAAILLVIVGLYWMTTTWWREGTLADRNRALMTGVSTMAVVAAGLHYLSKGIAANPAVDFAPSLFVLLAVGLAYELYTYGLRRAHAQDARATERALPDAVIELDANARIRALSPVAVELFPEATQGTPLHLYSPEVARHAEFCMRYQCDDLMFEAILGDAIMWGRIRRILDEDGRPSGCRVVLSDLTVAHGAHAGPSGANEVARQTAP